VDQNAPEVSNNFPGTGTDPRLILSELRNPLPEFNVLAAAVVSTPLF